MEYILKSEMTKIFVVFPAAKSPPDVKKDHKALLFLVRVYLEPPRDTIYIF